MIMHKHHVCKCQALYSISAVSKVHIFSSNFKNLTWNVIESSSSHIIRGRGEDRGGGGGVPHPLGVTQPLGVLRPESAEEGGGVGAEELACLIGRYEANSEKRKKRKNN